MIAARGLSRRFGATVAVRDLNVDVAPGEVFALLGPNGAGKTTALRVMAGLLGATAGDVEICGVAMRTDPQRAKTMVGFAPEHPALYREMSVREFLAFCAGIRGVRRPADAVDTVLNRFKLVAVADRLIGRLSKGFQQRVGLAQSVVHAPRVLLLDEPTSGLDPAQRSDVLTWIRAFAQDGCAVMLSTHALSEVRAVCHRLAVIDDGHLRATAALSELECTPDDETDAGADAHRIERDLEAFYRSHVSEPST